MGIAVYVVYRYEWWGLINVPLRILSIEYIKVLCCFVRNEHRTRKTAFCTCNNAENMSEVRYRLVKVYKVDQYSLALKLGRAVIDVLRTLHFCIGT